jgi:hypothetical protein
VKLGVKLSVHLRLCVDHCMCVYASVHLRVRVYMCLRVWTDDHTHAATHMHKKSLERGIWGDCPLPVLAAAAVMCGRPLLAGTFLMGARLAA